MFYSFAITVPKDTTEANAVEQELNLTHGIIIWTGIQFPAGCAGLAHCRLLYRRHQIWPTNIDEYFTADDYIVPIEENFKLDEAPYDLTALLWNTDDTYSHTITIYVDIVESTIAILIMKVVSGLAKFLKLAGIKV